MEFKDLGLTSSLLHNIRNAGYETPTPIQQATIPLVLEGKDVLGCAQTGTGKTAAFALPILQRLKEIPPKRNATVIRSLILSPTRELAMQTWKTFSSTAKEKAWTAPSFSAVSARAVRWKPCTAAPISSWPVPAACWT